MPDKKRSVTIFFFLLVFGLMIFFIYQGCMKLSFREAENSLTGFLLNQKAIHGFVADVQRPEVFRLQQEGILSPDYFSPILFSRTFIARNIKDALNLEREKAGLDAVSFKLASKNPRNDVNAADEFEIELLDRFSTSEISEYRSVLSTEAGKVLYYAIPVSRNTSSCLRCHGNPDDAPKEMVRKYGPQAGFFEKEGDIRALISVRVPLGGLLQRALSTTIILSSVAFVLLSVFLAVVFTFFRKIDLERKSAEETSYYLHSILNTSKDTAIIVTDSSEVVVYFNKAAEVLLGADSRLVPGMSLLEIHSMYAGQPAERVERKLESIKKVGSYRFGASIENKFIDIRISSIADKGGKYRGLLFIGHDVSEQVAAKKEQESLQARLHKAEKMESIGLMASGVAHDLNNILAGITSYPELILMNLDEESPMRRPVKAVEEAGLRAAAVVGDLLTVARGAAIVKEVVSLNDLVDEYMASPEHRKLAAANPNVSWEVWCERKLKNVLCAPVHFKKCIMNLMRNGVEAMGGDGFVRLSTRRAEIDEKVGSALGIASGEYSVVSLQDNGPGISPADIDHIFEPFYTKKKMGFSGTGLGLSVVWNTMHDHGGTVTVRSDEGMGTTFDLYFPASGEAVTVMIESEPIEKLQGNDELVLVVDDEERLRDIATQKLIALGYRVEVVSSGEEAVKYLHGNDVDLVLLDMIMDPGISGYETYKRIVEFKPGQKALIVSGYSTSSDIDKATRLGVGGFLKKPYTLAQLGAVIRQVLGNH